MSSVHERIVPLVTPVLRAALETDYFHSSLWLQVCSHRPFS